MACCPPIARDRLIGLSGVNPSVVKRMELAGKLPARLPQEALDAELVKVCLRIQRFDPHEVQFGDALVSSAVVWFRNAIPTTDHSIEFTFGGSLSQPRRSITMTARQLRVEPKWTRLTEPSRPAEAGDICLGDLLTVKRGIATGTNEFFVLTPEQTQAIAANVYLMLYPKPALAEALRQAPPLAQALWQKLNQLDAIAITREGRVCGGGLHKVEPNELANVPLGGIAALVGTPPPASSEQLILCEGR